MDDGVHNGRRRLAAAWRCLRCIRASVGRVELGVFDGELGAHPADVRAMAELPAIYRSSPTPTRFSHLLVLFHDSPDDVPHVHRRPRRRRRTLAAVLLACCLTNCFDFHH